MSGFAVAGGRPRVEVCVELIQGLAEKEPISESVVLTELESRTGVRCDRAAALSSMWEATERLHRDGIPGVRHVRGGWVRLDDEGAMRWADDRDRRGTRQFVRRARGAAAADPERLSGADRLRRDFYIEADRKVSEITARRSQRLRPIQRGEISSETA